MIKIVMVFFILMFFIFIISLCFASAREEKFYDKAIINKKIESNKK